jgi:hypothetical protein
MVACSFSGSDPRVVMPLPGDYDHLEKRDTCKEDVIEKLKKYKLIDKWKFDKIIYG